ncbi:hypothetical protein SLEP1_g5027 [Rubroshorea leprosula]|uniref:Disease resistance RPP13-like protein 1 n=1 Tax=Rubroshorea leprosula TaxID=152421 RepID=A0AAV5HWI3_9ROSI|nr:hypothetical protein SLEP1_g5027 [Rubroshorea leprosula]
MEFLSVAGGAFLTIAFERLFDKLEFSRSLNLQKQVLNKLRHWESLLPIICAFLEDAEEKQMSNSSHLVKKWLDKMRDLAYDIEDILDEFQVESQKKSNFNPKPHQGSTSKFIPSFINCFQQSDLTFDSQTISKVDDITLKLQYLVDESKLIGLVRQVGDKPSGMATRRSPTTSLPELYVCGRQTEKTAILDKLLNDEGGSKGFSVIPILGMGGIGKTTLARLVYNEVTTPQNFEIKSWVCVSDQFDITSITKAILEAVGGNCALNNLDLLQQELNSKLSNKKFLLRSSGNESRFLMHDLIHDLAQFVAGESCFTLEHKFEVDKKSKVKYEKVRHLSCIRGYRDTSKKFEVLNVMKCLRTFIPVGSKRWCNISNTVVHDWLPKLRCLRVLSLECYKINKLPDSVGDLIHLRYLNLSKTEIERLPESVGFLLQLQTLLLFNCWKILKLPVTIGNLVYLHHLDIEGTSSLKEMPSEIRKLSILNLENVLNVQDAMEADLKNIDGLDELHLEWTSDFGNTRNKTNEEMQILKWLKPHSNLKSLTIVSYGGQEFPSWIGDPIFSNLSYLKLGDCKRCTLSPSLGLSPVLKELIIEGIEGIETVGPEFYGNGTFSPLEKLVFRNMLNWKEWISPTRNGGEFPCLGHLEIENCPKLTGQLPSQLSSLVNLVINGCPELRCSCTTSLVSLKTLHIGDCSVILLKSMVDLTSLTQLRIENISEMSCLPKCFTQFLTALENLEIEGCKELTCLWEDGSETINLARLEKMEIRSCPLLVSLTGKEQGLLPLNLKHLVLYSCEALESLLPDLMMRKMGGSNNNSTDMLRLEGLEFHGCPSLRSLSLPITVKRLTIEGCENLESLPDAILMQDDGDNNSNLEYLYIEKHPPLNSFLRGQLPASLKEFKVHNCEGLESISKGMLHQCTGLRSIQFWNCQRLKGLPSLDCLSNLIGLNIINCDALESIPNLGLCIPNLKVLRIWSCKNLKSFPNTTMSQLKSLQELYIEDCPNIELIPSPGGSENGGLLLDLPPNLTKVSLDDAILKFLLPNTTQKLSNPVPDGHLATVAGSGLHNLTSLQHLSISCRTWPPEIVLPSSLTSLYMVAVENLESIPRELLQNLNSLQWLGIWRWPKLRSLPKEGLPPSLEELNIFTCPLLKRQRFEAEGDHWPLTHTIPYVEIDGNQAKGDHWPLTHTIPFVEIDGVQVIKPTAMKLKLGYHVFCYAFPTKNFDLLGIPIG